MEVGPVGPVGPGRSALLLQLSPALTVERLPVGNSRDSIESYINYCPSEWRSISCAAEPEVSTSSTYLKFNKAQAAARSFVLGQSLQAGELGSLLFSTFLLLSRAPFA